MHSIDNLFKLNELKINKKNTNFETMSIGDLQQNYRTFQNLTNNKKLVASLPDKGEKMIQQFKHIESVLLKRSESSDLDNIIDKLQVIDIEIKKETLEDRPIEKLKKETKPKTSTETKSNTNYFSRPVKAKAADKSIVNKQNLNLAEVKEKVKNKLNEQNKLHRQAKTIPFEECVQLLQLREKRVQEYQLEQTAKKLIEGQSVAYDYSFAKTENIRERKYRSTGNDDLLSDNESDLDDNEYEDYDFRLDDGEDDEKSSRIDRVYKSRLDNYKFRPNLEDLEKIE